MATYSFLNVSALIAGPLLVAQLASGAGAAEEGITIEAIGDKNEMTIGADGAGQHSMIASDAVKVTVKLLKTSPVNAILMAAYNAQSASAALWGSNVITVTDSARNDLHVIQKAAFTKRPNINYAKEAGMIEWQFDAIKGTSVLGAGL